MKEFKSTLICFTHTLSEELVVDWPMDVISVLVQKKVISNTTFEGNTMIIIEVWQTILANKMIMHKSSKLMVYGYKTIQLCFANLIWFFELIIQILYTNILKYYGNWLFITNMFSLNDNNDTDAFEIRKYQNIMHVQ